MIDDSEEIAHRHGGVRSAMADREGFHALMMCCLQIGETMGKITTPSYCEVLPVSLATALRNMIAHDYLGVSPEIIIDTLEINIPELKEKIEHIFEKL
ncbi:HepT-like ribonuclease domain-containing protein [Candidatus Venteria ishoeyi]|uniref:DUF86 domain-containing protein n=1 Tax=Candidatus Venteria ishoeyi TaxID=1899563 RepID=A0A1H6FBU3_9GAMM|nr:HepT-like ribonuclease domain-containing protein [Candidatus Venteria ishoeyi]SEH07548.1 Uncharacterised protein [Candidatus Venteria ishoeyi]